jgi:uncharacterized protein YdhG (YjbR/CyaY superfamily)
MSSSKPSKTTIDDYIEGFRPGVQARLRKIRATIRRGAPEAAQKISYGMPTFYLHGNLVHFAAFDRHIGFYPTPSGVARFRAELGGYKTSKGAVQFPHSEPLPLELIARIVEFRVAECTQQSEKKPDLAALRSPSL